MYYTSFGIMSSKNSRTLWSRQSYLHYDTTTKPAGLQKVAKTIVQNCSSDRAARGEQNAFLGSEPVFLQLLHAPFQLRRADGPLDDLPDAGAGIVVCNLVWSQLLATHNRRDDSWVEPSVGSVTQHDVIARQSIEELAQRDRPGSGSLVVGAARQTCIRNNINDFNYRRGCMLEDKLL